MEVYLKHLVRGVVLDYPGIDQSVDGGFGGREAGAGVLGGSPVLVKRDDGDLDPLVLGDFGLQGHVGELGAPPFGVGGSASPVVLLSLLVQGCRSTAVDFQIPLVSQDETPCMPVHGV